MLIFKYFGPPAAKASLQNPGEFTIRFNTPNSYNDPFELFLLPDESLTSEDERAYYELFLKQLPQAPVTCFSKRPDSVVMWAHYGQLSTGICIAIKENKLTKSLDFGFINDVNYSDEAAQVPAGMIRHAVATKKNRHTLSLLSQANNATYFTKRKSWAYEEERRLVVPSNEIDGSTGMMLKSFPSECAEAVILGHNASDETRETAKRWADDSGVNIFQMRYSRRVPEPLFRDNTETLLWRNSTFEVQNDSCPACFEPLRPEEDGCQWCAISNQQLATESMSYQTNLFLQLGIQDELPLNFSGLSPIGKKVT